MADIAASVLARLKNKAAKSGRGYQFFDKKGFGSDWNNLNIHHEFMIFHEKFGVWL